MKLIDISDCAETCSRATQHAFEIAVGAGRFTATVAGRRREANQVVFSALVDQRPQSDWAVVRRQSQHDYQIIEMRGSIPGFTEATLIELAKACIRAVRFRHIQG